MEKYNTYDDETYCDRKIDCRECDFWMDDFQLCGVPFIEDEDIPEMDKEANR